MSEFNGYDFDDPDTRKRMRYIVVRDGDLDINNVYAFKSKKEVKEFMKEDAGPREIYAVFKVQDITKEHKL